MELEKIFKTAKNLISADNGENIEYSRGICEFIADLDGHEDKDHAVRAEEVARELGVKEGYIKKMW